jgi:hypothetical protein
VHVRREQGADALVDEVLAHHAEQVVLGVAEQLLAFRPGQRLDDLLARHRRVVEQRCHQRPQLDAVRVPQFAERLCVLLGETRQRFAGQIEVAVDDDAGTITKRRPLLDRRLDVGKTVAHQFQIIDQRAVPHSHEEAGMGVEAKPRQRGCIGRGAAADPGVALEHRHLQAGTGQIGCGRQPVVPCADYNCVVGPHVSSLEDAKPNAGRQTSQRALPNNCRQ